MDSRNGFTADAARAILKAYKTLLSPLFAGSCRYAPSCSEYMAEAVERHGAVAGAALGLRRLATCHPLGGNGYDPVPENEPWRALVSRRQHADRPVEAAQSRVSRCAGMEPAGFSPREPGRASLTDVGPGISA